MEIRRMRPEDAEGVSEIDSLAFTPNYRKQGRGDMSPRRTRENICASIALNPNGCMVAEEDGLAGYVFSRVWGKTGWIGTFGVHPDRQGKGIGRRLLMEAVAGLEAAGCATIGLETMPDSCYNVGLYTRYGFRPAFLTLSLMRDIASAPDVPYRLLEEVGPEPIARISQASVTGLDYTCEALGALEHGWGETLFLGEPEPWASVTLRTVSRYASPPAFLEVHALSIHPQARHRLPEVIGAIESYAGARGFGRMMAPVNSADWPTLQWMLAHGFRTAAQMVRMFYRGDYQPKGVDMSRWAM